MFKYRSKCYSFSENIRSQYNVKEHHTDLCVFVAAGVKNGANFSELQLP